MRIPCPYCGPRDASEFTYGEDGSVVRPDPETVDQRAWIDYVYQRDNPRGPHSELWHHTAGCRQWLRVTRDTMSHAIQKVDPAQTWAAVDE
jgi:heterotetrameric sarcosine oxidase delta subunit